MLGEVPVAVVEHASTDDDQEFVQSLPNLVLQHLGPTYALDQVLLLQDIGFTDFPRTTSGKVKKFQVAAAVSEYRKISSERAGDKDQVTARVDSVEPEECLQSIVIGVWMRILGTTADSIGPQTSITSMADSLTMMQARRLLKKDHNLEISLPQLLANPTIAGQVMVLSGAEKDSKQATSQPPARSGPPDAFDIVESYGNTAKMQAVQGLVSPILGLYGLSWNEDVEDIIPMNDVLANMVVSRRRLRSSLRRDAFFCEDVSFDKLTVVLKEALSAHPILRSLWVPTSASSVSHLIVRPTNRSWEVFVDFSGHTVETPEDLRTIWQGDDERDICGSQKGPGPLFRVVMFHIRSHPGSTGFVYWSNHSAFDATSLSFFHETLEELLSGQKVTPRTSYKLWAQALYAGRHGPYAQAGAAYFGQKLAGFADYCASMVPQQRAPGFLEGNDRGWVDVSGRPDDTGLRRPLDGDLGRLQADKGLVRVIKCPGLGELQARHGIAAHLVFKAALAIANTDWTNTNTAFFRSLQSGRQWPFMDEALAAQLPSAADVDGPTLQASFNVINFNQHKETAFELFRRLKADQELATRYELTPLSLALASLPESDRNALMIRGLSQLFNWVPNRRHMNLTKLLQMQDEMNADTGLHWDFTALDIKSVEIFVRWDCCQLRQAELEIMLDDLEQCAQWVSDPSNWDKVLDERPMQSRYKVWKPETDEGALAAKSVASSG